MIRRTLTIAWKELLHLWKDRVLIPFFILGAIAELALIAWATSQPIDNLSMTLALQDEGTRGAALVAELDANDTLTQVHEVDDAAAIRELMNTNETVVGVVIPADYSQRLEDGEQPTVEVLLNGAKAMSAREAQWVAQQVILEQGMREAFDLEPEDYEDQMPQVTVRYNEDLERSWYTLPAESGLMFYMMTMALAALGISREREQGTYEQLLVMPFRSYEVVLGKALAPMLVGYCLFLAMLGLTVLAFGVPLRGSLGLLLVLAVIYLFAEIGKGVLASMISKTQLQAVLLVFVVAMVDMVFSGYAVAVETMPPFMQSVANFVSIRHWLIIMRSIMLKDVGLDVLWPHVLAIMAIGTVILTVTAIQYRRRLA